MKKISICLVILLLLQPLFLLSCADNNSYHSLNIINADNEKMIHKYMNERGYKKENYIIVERFLRKEWSPELMYQPTYGGSTYMPCYPNKDAPESYYSACLFENEKMTNAVSFRILNGVLTEETTSEQQTLMLFRAVNELGLSYLISMTIGSAFDVTAVYCLEDTEDDAKFVFYKTTVGDFVYCYSGNENKAKQYFLPHYSLSKMLSIDMKHNLENGKKRIVSLLEHMETELEPYDIEKNF